MKTFLTNLHALIRKEYRSLFADLTMVILIAYMFTGMVASQTKASSELRNVAVAVVDYDRSILSYRIRDAIGAPYFLMPEETTPQQAEIGMDKGDYVFTLEFPPNFQRDVQLGRQPKVLLQVDATRMSQAGIGTGYISQMFEREIRNFIGVQPPLPVAPVVRMRYNANADNAYQIPTGAINGAIMLLLMLLVGSAVIRERERGTMEHLLVMPVSAAEIMLAKIISNGVVILLASTLSLYFIAHLALGMPINGSIALFVAGTVVYLFSVASMAIMLATFTPTMPQFSLLVLPLYLTMIMFSGMHTSRNNMPQTAQWISEYWPSTQFYQFSQSVVARGGGVEIVWHNLVIMAITGALFLGLALVRFRKMLEKQG